MTFGTCLRDQFERFLGQQPGVKSHNSDRQKALDAFSSRSQSERGDVGTRYRISYPIQTKIMPQIWYERSLRRPPNVVRYSDDNMSVSAVQEALVQLGIMLNFNPYAVCGLAAMASYGYTTRLPHEMTICCPSWNKYNIFQWIAAAGLPVNPEHPNAFGIELSDGSVRKVAIEWMADNTFAELSTAKSGPSAVNITTMPILVDTYAGLYMRDLEPSTRKVLDEDIIWLLRRMAADRSPGQLLRRETIPNVLDPLFWSIFNKNRPDAAELWSQAWDYRRPLRAVRAVADLRYAELPSREDMRAHEQQTRQFVHPTPLESFMDNSSGHSAKSDRSADMRFITLGENSNSHDIMFVPVDYGTA